MRLGPCAAIGAARDPSGEGGEVGVDHHRCVSSSNETAGSQPSTARALRRVADQVVDLGRPQQRGIVTDVLAPVEPDVAEGELGELAHAVRLAGGDDVVARLAAAAA